MSWPFLYLQRRTFASSDRWGTLSLRTVTDEWERLCYSYELPWLPDASGQSRPSVSRIRLGEYEMEVRSDGLKGWRLQLRDTGHRTYIQIHRAHRTMVIEGCILPVHFDNLSPSPPNVGDPIIQTRSVALMQQIRVRYYQLLPGRPGRATILITARLPPRVDTGLQVA